MSLSEPIVRKLSVADVPRCLELSTEAYWNQTAEDWRFLIEQAHAYGLELPQRGLVATTIGWDMPPGVAWINMVLVTKTARGKGFARELIQRALADAAGRGMTAALDATALGVPVYERLGFTGEARLVRLKCPAAMGSGGGIERTERVQPMAKGDLDAVIALDAAVLGANRGAMIEAWRERLPEAAWCVKSPVGHVTGFMLGRPGRVATQLGPVVAEDSATAQALIGAVLSTVAGPVMIDVPVARADLVAGLERIGFGVERDFRRMGLGGRLPTTDWLRYFAVAGPDFA